MPVSQLKHPLFNADKREELMFPTFNAVRCNNHKPYWVTHFIEKDNVTKGAAGKILQFTRSERSILRAYGVPKNLVVEVRRSPTFAVRHLISADC